MSQKRILFLHPNFPAQFKHLARAAATCGHDARFLCQTHYGRSLPGVQRLTLKGNASHEHLMAQGGNQIQRSATLAEQYRRGLVNLDDSGWQPDVVVSGPEFLGRGLGGVLAAGTWGNHWEWRADLSYARC